MKIYTEIADILTACDLVDEAVKSTKTLAPESYKDLVDSVNGLIISSAYSFNYDWSVNVYAEEEPTYGYNVYSSLVEKRKAVLSDLENKLTQIKKKALSQIKDTLAHKYLTSKNRKDVDKIVSTLLGGNQYLAKNKKVMTLTVVEDKYVLVLGDTIYTLQSEVLVKCVVAKLLKI